MDATIIRREHDDVVAAERELRLAKLDALRERGIEPYPAGLRARGTPWRRCTSASPGSPPTR